MPDVISLIRLSCWTTRIFPSITINPAATTMMACPDMEIEDAILKAMGNVKGVKAGQSENEMLLVDADGNVLMVLSKN